MDRWTGKVAVVTGASSGIGAAIAEKLVEEGVRVVGLARRKDRLDEMAHRLSGKKGEFLPLKTDISLEEDVIQAFDWIRNNAGPVHILINNAGVMKTTSLCDGDTAAWQETFQVNVLGLSIATREAVKAMKLSDVAGHVIHVNSGAGHVVPNYPGLNVYPASKFAVTALTETLRLELNSLGSRIKVTSISPGLTLTEMIPEEVVGQIQSNEAALEPEQIADAVVYVLSTPPHVQVQELTIKPIMSPV